MPLTNAELREIKKFVDMGFGLKVSYPTMSENQTLTIYKEYLIRPKYKPMSPGERYISVRNLKPGQKLSPGGSPRNFKINNTLLGVPPSASKLKGKNKLLKVNGKPPSPRFANKKSSSAGKS